jgi:7-cyano-7-deazaguanine synthase
LTKAVVLLSGGADSSTMLAMAIHDHQIPAKEILCLSLYYGQLHSLEIDAAERVAGHYRCEHVVKVLPREIFEGGGSTIMQKDSVEGAEMPHMTYKEIAEDEGVSPTYVPFRNGNLLSAATSIALVRKAEAVYFGAHAEDARNWAYPDCTPEFIGAIANAIWVGSYHKVRLVTPLEWMMKKDIIWKGHKLQVPFELTMSCYEGLSPACGKCPTCVERLEAFKTNRLHDPLPYAEGVLV